MATILVVEDEDALRETLSRFLVHEGHQVIAAASGLEALDIGFDASPDVLIADWMLKDQVHGLHVSEAFRGLHPNINTILITGFPSRDLLEESDRCGVSMLLEKPFPLDDLLAAVNEALVCESQDRTFEEPVAALAIGTGGRLEFVSDQAGKILGLDEASTESMDLGDLFEGDVLERLTRSEEEWIRFEAKANDADGYLIRSRRRPGGVGWISVLCALEEERVQRDPRVRTLLDARSSSSVRSLDGHGPIVVVERDGVVRRLIVSQVERLGAICYPSDDLESALQLVAEEPRARTILVDFVLAGRDMDDWVSRIHQVRPEMAIVGTGVVGAESDIRARGIAGVLRKPWRIDDLVEAIVGRR
jgi:DNA-binding NtrC family response regulator